MDVEISLPKRKRVELDSTEYHESPFSPRGSFHNRKIQKCSTYKWKKMLDQIKSSADWDLYLKTKPELLEIGIREGIPDCVRSFAWQLTSGGYHLLHSHPGLYNQHLIQSDSSSNQSLSRLEDMGIAKDIDRTLKSQQFSNQVISRKSLYNVLKAYSNYDHEVGYTEGMSYIAALLLLYMNEEEAFWVMAALLKQEGNKGLRGLYTNYQIYDLYVFQFESLLKEQLPVLASYFEKQTIKAGMFFPWWFMTLFAARFPLTIVVRIWDLFFSEGLGIIFRVGLALLKHCEEYLVRLGYDRLKHTLAWGLFPKDALDPGMLLPLVYSVKIEKSRMEELQVEHERRKNLPCLRLMESVRRQPSPENTEEQASKAGSYIGMISKCFGQE